MDSELPPQLQAPFHVQVEGLFMLCAARLGARQDGFCSRLVNKWKGWARFRQEPALLEQANTDFVQDLG